MGCFGINLMKIRLQQARKLMRNCGLEVKLVEIASSTSCVECWAPAKKSGRPALVLIHGFVFNALLEWENQMQAFAEQFDVYVPNLIFFGLSTTESTERSEIFQAQCMKQMLDALQVSEAHVLGTSYGGTVAYLMAHLYPESIAKVVICSAAVVMDHEDLEKILERYGGVTHPAQILMPKTIEGARKTIEFATQKKPVFLPDCLVEDIIEETFSYNPEFRHELLDGMEIGSVRNPSPVPPLSKDVLIVWGEKDQIFTQDLAHRLHRHVDKSILEIIPGTAHAPQVDNPKAFNKIVLTFLL